MAEQSEITSSDLAAVTAGATACDHLTELAATRTKFATFLDWIVNDSDGNLAADFKTAIINQLLFDAAKKGWFVRTNPTTGFLELVQRIALADLPQPETDVGDTDERIIVWNGDSWEFQNTNTREFKSEEQAVPDPSSGGVVTIAHGLTAAPTYFGAYLLCKTTDIGFAVNDRVDVSSVIGRGNGGTDDMPGMTVRATASSVSIIVGNLTGDKLWMWRPDTFAKDDIDPTLWKLVLWAKL